MTGRPTYDELEQRVKELENEAFERKRAEEALRENEALLKAAIESTEDGILAVDENGKTIIANLRFRRMWRMPDELFNKKDDEKMLSFVLDQLKEPDDFLSKVQNLYGTTKENLDLLNFKDGRIFERYSRPMTIGEKLTGRVWSFRDITKRTQSEVALRENEVFLKVLIDAIPTPVFYKDRDGKYIGFNSAFERFFGSTRKRLIGKSVFDIHPPELAKVYHAQDNELFNGGGVQNYQTQWKTSNGNVRDIIFNKAVFTDNEGDIRGLIGTIIDITERKQAEEALRESEEKYRNLVEESFDGIFIQKGQSIVFANKRLNEMLGYGDGELIGQDHWVVYHPDYQKLTRERAQARMRGDKVVRRYEVKLQRKDGSWFYGEINARPITFHSDQESGIQVWVKDIDERKRAEESLRESEEKYRSLANNLNTGIYRNSVGPEGQFIEANPAIVKMFGFHSKQEFLESKVSDLYKNPEDRIAYNEKLLRNSQVKNEELQLRKKDGAVIIGSVSAVVVKDENGDVRYFDGIIEDITERKHAEVALSESGAKFRSIFENKGTATGIFG